METINQIVARLEKTFSRLEDKVKTLTICNAELSKKVEVQNLEIIALKAENDRLKNRKNSNNSSIHPPWI